MIEDRRILGRFSFFFNVCSTESSIEVLLKFSDWMLNDRLLTNIIQVDRRSIAVRWPFDVLASC